MPRTAPKNLRRCSSKRGHPRLKHAPPESERVFPHNNQVDQLQHSKLVQENPKNHCDNEHCQLGHNQAQVGNAQDFGTNYTTNAKRRDPAKKKRNGSRIM